MRWFNIAGPCQPDIHYLLSAQYRLPEIAQLIEQRGDFIIHAPRQTGKTTAMLTLVQELTAAGNLHGADGVGRSGCRLFPSPRAGRTGNFECMARCRQRLAPTGIATPGWVTSGKDHTC